MHHSQNVGTFLRLVIENCVSHMLQPVKKPPLYVGLLTTTHSNIYIVSSLAVHPHTFLSRWKEEHHQRKLIVQWVQLPHVQVEYLCQQIRKKPPTTVTTTTSTMCKGQEQYQRKLERDAATTCNSNHHYHYRPALDHRWSTQHLVLHT